MIAPFSPQPLTLVGRYVRLETLTQVHGPALLAAGADPVIWRWLSRPPFASFTDVQAWIDAALVAQATGLEVPFATLRQSDGVVVGSTRYLDIRRPHRALEIGWTWLTPVAQRTAINTEAKLLMLSHAFEVLGALRVQLKTDERNAQSRAAIARLGAHFEGILRNYQTREHDGYVRNTAMYSITDAEWPAVKVGLVKKLAG